LELVEHPAVTVTGTGEDPSAYDASEFYRTTIAGNALAKARVGKPMARTDAVKLLEGVIARAEDANRSGRWLDWVVEIVLYGSLALEGDEPVGDVDVAVRIE